ncbi:MAG: hypothetical protein HZC02_00535 [Candidatus Levybacteria bacterium]|nr:hypothetical protein [Candidatus Levybacteria bacterium]
MNERQKRASVEMHLVGREDQSPEEFLSERQRMKIHYSQPAFPQSPEVIKKRASQIIYESPLTVTIPGYKPSPVSDVSEDAIVEYDKTGRAVKVTGSTLEYTREYSPNGYITHEVIRKTDAEGIVTEEFCEFSYGMQRGNYCVQRISVTPYRVTGEQKTQIKSTFLIDLTDLYPHVPLKKSAPSF